MAAAWINEFHYDNAGTDSGEYIEIAAAAGTDLSGWTIVLYNGANGLSYNSRSLSGIVPNQQNGFGTLSFGYPTDGIQNGAPDAIALIDPLGNVVEFLSYEGSFTAQNGPAAGLTSTDIGVSEPGNTSGTAVGRTGTGDEASDFTWSLIGNDTPGGVNAGQNFGGTPVDRAGTFSIGDASVAEGNSGTTTITFTVSRGADSNVAASVNWTIGLPGAPAGADASDFAAPTLSGTLVFGADEISRTITLQVNGDTSDEGDETFTVTLSGPTNGAALGDGEATGTIVDDDGSAGPGSAFINEIHYDDAGTDAGEAIEIAAPAGTNLAGWTLVLYSVSGSATEGTVYNTLGLSGIVPDQDDGYGTLSFAYPVNGIQNGPQDGLALVNPQGQVVQFLSYEGSFIAANGPAAGMTSTDIGVFEGSSTPEGFSLQLTGSGASAVDFTWVDAREDSFGSVNEGQDFIALNATGQVRIGDASVVEGDSGETLLVFTVTRAGGLGEAAGVDWLLSLGGSANSADLGAAQPLSGEVDFAPGVSSVQVAIRVSGDVIGEGNETLELVLANPTGNITIVDGSATGTIVNDDPLTLAVYQIQGEGHRSGYEGQPVTTSGVVTAVAANGFYLQDPNGDGNVRTSDALFVFTGAAPGVAVGDALEVSGTVAEFLPGGDATNLTITELISSNIVVQSSGNAVPDAVVIGAGGRLPPTSAIDDDGLSSYDPETDGIDFYESLEGMLATIEAPRVVVRTNEFGETYVVASGGEGASGVNGRGGITLSDGDYNPEKIQIDATPGLFAGYDPQHSQGDLLGDVTGIFSYGFGSYELLVTQAVTVTDDVTLDRETTELQGDSDHLTVASFNVENLSPDSGAAKFNLLAEDIVYSLAAPDIVALQEVQDGNGLNGSDPLSGAATAQLLIDAIAAAGGPNYVYVEVAPSSQGSTGGASGGNIRNGYLYNADRVGYVDGSARLIEDPAFNGSRRPLVADFTFNGETVKLINVHFTSRIGSDPLWGSSQPPADAGDASRTQQAEAVRAYVNGELATDPSLKLGVFGDFNGFWFEESVTALEAGGVMTDLHRLLDAAERYTYLFDGNLQAIDHGVVTGGLLAGAQFDVVHINAEQAEGAGRSSDHDPIVARFRIEAPNEAPTAVDDGVAVAEDAATANLWAQLLANDFDPDAGDSLTIAAVDTGATLGSLVFDPEAETLVYVADDDSFDDLAPGATYVDSFTYTVTDEDGLTSSATVSVTVTGVADGIVLSGGNRDDELQGTAGEDELSGGNGADRLFGLGGHDRLEGGNHDDQLFGGAGHDRLEGGNHYDHLHGGDGDDVLSGGNHNDLLNGGAGDDLLIGGNHNDVFAFTDLGGHDVIADFRRGQDKIDLSGLDAVEGGGHDAFAWIGSGAFSGTAGELRAYSDGGSHLLAGDVDGDGIADFTIQSNVALQQADFIFA
ncbi:Calx-beta domain-containing protein [Sphingosinicella terrae]|uniref:Calx-beta domain-containing protein n=1 Tax=Sphingosinicella terrae TaxID=2172047 RepID=UPI000E0D2292|nr:Ig-like domain-containing protein [Sphingosinicella terrae]